MRALLEEARVPHGRPTHSEEGSSSGEDTATKALQAGGANESAPGKVQEVQEVSQSQMGATTVWSSSGGGGRSGTGASSGAGGGRSGSSAWARLQSGSTGGGSYAAPDQQQQQEQGRSPSMPEGPAQVPAGEAAAAGLGPSRLSMAAMSAGDALVTISDKGIPNPAGTGTMPNLQGGELPHSCCSWQLVVLTRCFAVLCCF